MAKYVEVGEEYEFFRRWGMGHVRAVDHLMSEYGLAYSTILMHLHRAGVGVSIV